MPLPNGLESATVIGEYTNPDGSGRKGTITFTPQPSAVASASLGAIVLGPVSVSPSLLDGSFSVTLLAPDASGITPSGWTYTVTEAWKDGTAGRTYSIALSAAQSPVKLASLAPAGPSTGTGNLALLRANNLSDVEDPAAARANLGISGSSNPWEFDVATYGAIGDGVTNDTQAIRDTITAAVNWAVTNGRYDCTVVFRNASYLISSAPVKGGTTSGNAQIPLPVIAPTANKVTLRLKGVGSAALPHWQQTNPQVNGTMLISTYQEQMDNTHGECSVIGGPTPQHGYGTAAQLFNNLLVIADGVSIRTKANHTAGYISGFDFRGCAEVWMVQGLVSVDQAPPSIVFPNGAGYEFGLAMPFPGNNAMCRVDNFSVEGFTYGAMLSEHTVFQQIQAVYCYDGIAIIGSFEGSGAQQHTMHGVYACVEACTNALLTTTGARVQIDQLDVENISGLHVKTSDGTEVGYVGLGGIISNIAVSDPCGLEVVYIDRQPGPFNAPSIPASGNSFRSTAWRNAAVTITGGTVTGIAVDGVATGLTSGTVIVPSGRHITLTYSVAPTWVWTLL